MMLPPPGGLLEPSCASGQGELLPHRWTFLVNAGLWGSASPCLFSSLLERALNLEIKILLRDKVASLKQNPACQPLAFSVQVLNLSQLTNFWQCLHPEAWLLPTCESSASASLPAIGVPCAGRLAPLLAKPDASQESPSMISESSSLSAAWSPFCFSPGITSKWITQTSDIDENLALKMLQRRGGVGGRSGRSQAAELALEPSWGFLNWWLCGR